MSGPTDNLDLYKDGADEEIVLEGTLSNAPDNPSASTSSSIPQPGFNTLDEPIKDTILRDVKAVARKFMHVLYPVEKKSLLRVSSSVVAHFNKVWILLDVCSVQEWDLWGPLILCTFMATVLQGHDTNVDHKDGDGGPEFAEVFVIVWLGALVVTLNTKLLGGNISFFQVRTVHTAGSLDLHKIFVIFFFFHFQSVCVLGYCLLPLSISLVVCRIALLAGHSSALFFVR